RLGFAVGNERLIGALIRVKSYLDYGAFTPIQVACAAALNGPQHCVDEIRQIYRRRRDCVVVSLPGAGWPIPSPPATMFAWAPIPEVFSHLGSLEFSSWCLRTGVLPYRPASASASTARALCVSRWSRTSSASARRRAISANSSLRRRGTCI